MEREAKVQNSGWVAKRNPQTSLYDALAAYQSVCKTVNRSNLPFSHPQTDSKDSPPARRTAGPHNKKQSELESMKTTLAQHPLGPIAIV